MKCLSTLCKKGVALGLCLVLVITGQMPFAHAQEMPAAAPKEILSSKNLSDVTVPAEWGEVSEYYAGGERTVILIQDAHAVPDAQMNLHALIRHFEKKYGVTQVAVEGSASALDAQFFKSFPDQKILKTVLKEYYRRAELSGAGAALVFSNPDVQFYGVEDWNLYEDAIMAYLGAANQAERLKNIVENERARLAQKKQAVYSDELLRLDSLIESFYAETNELQDLLQALSEVRLPPQGSELDALIHAIKKDGLGGSDSLSQDIEVRAIAERVEKLLTRPEEIRMFNAQKQEWMTGAADAQTFAAAMQEMARKNGVEINMSRELSRDVQNHRRLKSIQGTRLLKELEAYIRVSKEQLIQRLSDPQGAFELDRQTERLRFLNKMMNLELSRENWDAVKEMNVPEGYAEHLAFYHNAEEREQAFFRNMKRLGWLEPGENAAPVVFVAGGFHAQGMTQKLKEAGLSYLLVTPQIKQLPEENLYRQHMAGDVSWKSYFKVEDGKIKPYDAFLRGLRDELLKQDASPYTLKLWRDQIIRDLASRGRAQDAWRYTRFIDELSDEKPAEGKLERFSRRVDQFLSGLRLLNSQSKLDQTSIVRLLNSMTAVDAFTGTAPWSPPVVISAGAVQANPAPRSENIASNLFFGPEILNASAVPEILGKVFGSDQKDRTLLVSLGWDQDEAFGAIGVSPGENGKHHSHSSLFQITGRGDAAFMSVTFARVNNKFTFQVYPPHGARPGSEQFTFYQEYLADSLSLVMSWIEQAAIDPNINSDFRIDFALPETWKLFSESFGEDIVGEGYPASSVRGGLDLVRNLRSEARETDEDRSMIAAKGESPGMRVVVAGESVIYDPKNRKVDRALVRPYDDEATKVLKIKNEIARVEHVAELILFPEAQKAGLDGQAKAIFARFKKEIVRSNGKHRAEFILEDTLNKIKEGVIFGNISRAKREKLAEITAGFLEKIQNSETFFYLSETEEEGSGRLKAGLLDLEKKKIMTRFFQLMLELPYGFNTVDESLQSEERALAAQRRISFTSWYSDIERSLNGNASAEKSISDLIQNKAQKRINIFNKLIISGEEQLRELRLSGEESKLRSLEAEILMKKQNRDKLIELRSYLESLKDNLNAYDFVFDESDTESEKRQKIEDARQAHFQVMALLQSKFLPEGMRDIFNEAVLAEIDKGRTLTYAAAKFFYQISEENGLEIIHDEPFVDFMMSYYFQAQYGAVGREQHEHDKSIVVFSEAPILNELQYQQLLASMEGHGRIVAIVLSRSARADEVDLRYPHWFSFAKQEGIVPILNLSMSDNIASVVRSGEITWVDGHTGEVIHNPDDKTREELKQRSDAYKYLNRYLQLKAQDPAPVSGSTEIEFLYDTADISHFQEDGQRKNLAETRGGQGVGLFRMEKLLTEPGRDALEGDEHRLENALLEFVTSKFFRERPSSPFIIRLFDVQDDKRPRFLLEGKSEGEVEEIVNGFSNVRFYLGDVGDPMFREFRSFGKRQIRAIMSAALRQPHPGMVKILFPNVLTTEEILMIESLIQDAEAELIENSQSEGDPLTDEELAVIRNIPVGYMVEDTKVVQNASNFVLAVKTLERSNGRKRFLAVGSNDLLKSILRDNPVTGERDQMHPQMVADLFKLVQVANQNSLEITIEGEWASKPQMLLAAIYGKVQSNLKFKLVPVPEQVPYLKALVRELKLADYSRPVRYDGDGKRKSLQKALREAVDGEIPSQDLNDILLGLTAVLEQRIVGSGDFKSFVEREKRKADSANRSEMRDALRYAAHTFPKVGRVLALASVWGMLTALDLRADEGAQTYNIISGELDRDDPSPRMVTENEITVINEGDFYTNVIQGNQCCAVMAHSSKKNLPAVLAHVYPNNIQTDRSLSDFEIDNYMDNFANILEKNGIIPENGVFYIYANGDSYIGLPEKIEEALTRRGFKVNQFKVFQGSEFSGVTINANIKPRDNQPLIYFEVEKGDGILPGEKLLALEVDVNGKFREVEPRDNTGLYLAAFFFGLLSIVITGWGGSLVYRAFRKKSPQMSFGTVFRDELKKDFDAIRSEILDQGSNQKASGISRSEARAGQWGENRRPTFKIIPEDILIYHKRKGETVRRNKKKSIWSHLPAEWRSAKVVFHLPFDHEGIIVLSKNKEMNELDFESSNPIVRYEVYTDSVLASDKLERLRRGVYLPGFGLWKPHSVEPPMSRPLNRVIVEFSRINEKEFAQALSELGVRFNRLSRTGFMVNGTKDEIPLHGVKQGAFRRSLWDELIALLKIVDAGDEEIGLVGRDSKKAAQVELEDHEIIRTEFQKPDYIQSIADDIFARPDLGSHSWALKDIQHIGEGGFKRVYKVTARVEGEPSDFVWVAKLVKPDVVKSDSESVYDLNYVRIIHAMIQELQSYDLGFYPPASAPREVADSEGRTRIMTSEGFIKQTDAVLSDAQRNYWMLKTYFMMYLIFEEKRFVADPKPTNMAMVRRARSQFVATLVDLDNVYGEGIPQIPFSGDEEDLLDREVFSIAKDLAAYGFKLDEIVRVAYEVLGERKAKEVLRRADVASMSRFKFPEPTQIMLQQIQDQSASFPEAAVLSGQVEIVLNKRKMKVPEGITILDLMDHFSVPFQQIGVRLNGEILLSQGRLPSSRAEAMASYYHRVAPGMKIEWGHFDDRNALELSLRNSREAEFLLKSTLEKFLPRDFWQNLGDASKRLDDFYRSASSQKTSEGSLWKSFQRDYEEIQSRIRNLANWKDLRVVEPDFYSESAGDRLAHKKTPKIDFKEGRESFLAQIEELTRELRRLNNQYKEAYSRARKEVRVSRSEARGIEVLADADRDARGSRRSEMRDLTSTEVFFERVKLVADRTITIAVGTVLGVVMLVPFALYSVIRMILGNTENAFFDEATLTNEGAIVYQKDLQDIEQSVLESAAAYFKENDWTEGTLAENVQRYQTYLVHLINQVSDEGKSLLGEDQYPEIKFSTRQLSLRDLYRLNIVLDSFAENVKRSWAYLSQGEWGQFFLDFYSGWVAASWISVVPAYVPHAGVDLNKDGWVSEIRVMPLGKIFNVGLLSLAVLSISFLMTILPFVANLISNFSEPNFETVSFYGLAYSIFMFVVAKLILSLNQAEGHELSHGVQSALEAKIQLAVVGKYGEEVAKNIDYSTLAAQQRTVDGQGLKRSPPTWEEFEMIVRDVFKEASNQIAEAVPRKLDSARSEVRLLPEDSSIAMSANLIDTMRTGADRIEPSGPIAARWNDLLEWLNAARNTLAAVQPSDSTSQLELSGVPAAWVILIAAILGGVIWLVRRLGGVSDGVTWDANRSRFADSQREVIRERLKQKAHKVVWQNIDADETRQILTTFRAAIAEEEGLKDFFSLDHIADMKKLAEQGEPAQKTAVNVAGRDGFDHIINIYRVLRSNGQGKPVYFHLISFTNQRNETKIAAYGIVSYLEPGEKEREEIQIGFDVMPSMRGLRGRQFQFPVNSSDLFEAFLASIPASGTHRFVMREQSQIWKSQDAGGTVQDKIAFWTRRGFVRPDRKKWIDTVWQLMLESNYQLTPGALNPIFDQKDRENVDHDWVFDMAPDSGAIQEIYDEPEFNIRLQRSESRYEDSDIKLKDGVQLISAEEQSRLRQPNVALGIDDINSLLLNKLGERFPFDHEVRLAQNDYNKSVIAVYAKTGSHPVRIMKIELVLNDKEGGRLSVGADDRRQDILQQLYAGDLGDPDWAAENVMQHVNDVKDSWLGTMEIWAKSRGFSAVIFTPIPATLSNPDNIFVRQGYRYDSEEGLYVKKLTRSEARKIFVPDEILTDYAELFGVETEDNSRGQKDRAFARVKRIILWALQRGVKGIDVQDVIDQIRIRRERVRDLRVPVAAAFGLDESEADFRQRFAEWRQNLRDRLNLVQTSDRSLIRIEEALDFVDQTMQNTRGSEGKAARLSDKQAAMVLDTVAAVELSLTLFELKHTQNRSEIRAVLRDARLEITFDYGSPDQIILNRNGMIHSEYVIPTQPIQIIPQTRRATDLERGRIASVMGRLSGELSSDLEAFWQEVQSAWAKYPHQPVFPGAEMRSEMRSFDEVRTEKEYQGWISKLKGEFQTERKRIRLDEAKDWKAKSEALKILGDKYIRQIYEKMKQVYDLVDVAEDADESKKTRSPFALLAVGSYGRNQMSYISDYDLKIVYSEADIGWSEPAYQFLVYSVLDVLSTTPSPLVVEQIDVSQSLPAQLISELINPEMLTGNDTVFLELQTRWKTVLADAEFRKKITRIIIDLWQKGRERTHYFDGLFEREPNLKMGSGGLRDFENAMSMILTVYGSIEFSKQAKQLTDQEWNEAQKAHEFILKTRMALNQVQGERGLKNQDVLSVSIRDRVAEIMGYRSEPGQISAEDQFFTDYRKATETIFLFNNQVFRRAFHYTGSIKKYENEKFPVALNDVTLKGVQYAERTGETILLDRGLEQLDREKVITVYPDAKIDPAQIPHIFLYAAQNGYHITGELMDEIVRNRFAFQELLKKGNYAKEAAQIMNQVLALNHEVSYVLRRMQAFGLLGDIWPEYAEMDSREFNDIKHDKTLGWYSISTLRRFEAFWGLDESQDSSWAGRENPMPASVLSDIQIKNLLLPLRAALLVQAIAEAQPRATRALIRRFELSEHDQELVVWLAENKDALFDLLRSHGHQSVAEFNRFKKDVLSDSYEKWILLQAVTGIRLSFTSRARQAIYFERLNRIAGIDESTFESEEKIQSLIQSWEQTPLASAASEEVVPTEKVRVLETSLPDSSLHQFRVSVPSDWNAPGTLEIFSAALAIEGFSIHVMDIGRTEQGFLEDRFIVTGKIPKGGDSAVKIQEKIKKAFEALGALEAMELDAETKQAERDKIMDTLFKGFQSKRELGLLHRSGREVTKIQIKSQSGEASNQLQIETPDRPGLIYMVARVLRRHGIGVLANTTGDTIGYDPKVGMLAVDTFDIQKEGAALTPVELKWLQIDLDFILNQDIVTNQSFAEVPSLNRGAYRASKIIQLTEKTQKVFREWERERGAQSIDLNFPIFIWRELFPEFAELYFDEPSSDYSLILDQMEAMEIIPSGMAATFQEALNFFRMTVIGQSRDGHFYPGFMQSKAQAYTENGDSIPAKRVADVAKDWLRSAGIESTWKDEAKTYLNDDEIARFPTDPEGLYEFNIQLMRSFFLWRYYEHSQSAVEMIRFMLSGLLSEEAMQSRVEAIPLEERFIVRTIQAGEKSGDKIHRLEFAAGDRIESVEDLALLFENWAEWLKRQQDPFVAAQNLQLSSKLMLDIKHLTANLSEENLDKLRQSFADFLEENIPKASALRILDELGIIDKLLPGFSKLHRIYDVYEISGMKLHSYSVAAHTLYIIEVFDRLAFSTEDRFKVFRDLYQKVRLSRSDLLGLMLGILLHDSGKEFPAAGNYMMSHQMKGALKIVPALLSSFKLDPETLAMAEDIAWYHQHLNEMARDLAANRITLEQAVLDWIDRPGLTLQQWEILYLVNAGDYLGLGRDKMEESAHIESFRRLEELYLHVRSYLEETEAAAKSLIREKIQDKYHKNQVEFRTALQNEIFESVSLPYGNQGLSSQEIKMRVYEFVRLYPVSYLRKLDKRRVMEYFDFFMKLVKKQSEADSSPQVLFRNYKRADMQFLEMVVGVPKDRPELVDLITGVIASYVLSIHEANIQTSRTGVVMDHFQLIVPPQHEFSLPELKAAVEGDIERVIQGELSLEDIYRPQIVDIGAGATYQREGVSSFPLARWQSVSTRPVIRTQTRFQAPKTYRDRTILILQTADRIGLLHAVTGVISEGFGLDIRPGPISTHKSGVRNLIYLSEKDPVTGKNQPIPEDLQRKVSIVLQELLNKVNPSTDDLKAAIEKAKAMRSEARSEKLTELEGQLIQETFGNGFKREDGADIWFFGEQETQIPFAAGAGLVESNSVIPSDWFVNKKVLVAPGYGNLPFLIRKLGAEHVTAIDKDPATVAWQKLRYAMPQSRLDPMLLQVFDNSRGIAKMHWRDEIYGSLDLDVPSNQRQSGMSFSVADLLSPIPRDQKYDLIVVPYVFAVQNGIESEDEWNLVLKNLTDALSEVGRIVIMPAKIDQSSAADSPRKTTIQLFQNWIDGLGQRGFKVELSEAYPHLSIYPMMAVNAQYAVIQTVRSELRGQAAALAERESVRDLLKSFLSPNLNVQPAAVEMQARTILTDIEFLGFEAYASLIESLRDEILAGLSQEDEIKMNNLINFVAAALRRAGENEIKVGLDDPEFTAVLESLLSELPLPEGVRWQVPTTMREFKTSVGVVDRVGSLASFDRQGKEGSALMTVAGSRGGMASRVNDKVVDITAAEELPEMDSQAQMRADILSRLMVAVLFAGKVKDRKLLETAEGRSEILASVGEFGNIVRALQFEGGQLKVSVNLLTELAQEFAARSEVRKSA